MVLELCAFRVGALRSVEFYRIERGCVDGLAINARAFDTPSCDGFRTLIIRGVSDDRYFGIGLEWVVADDDEFCLVNAWNFWGIIDSECGARIFFEWGAVSGEFRRKDRASTRLLDLGDGEWNIATAFEFDRFLCRCTDADRWFEFDERGRNAQAWRIAIGDDGEFVFGMDGIVGNEDE